MPSRELRFGLRSGTRRGATWKVFQGGPGKSDVYLVCRSVGGAIKLSLHESGSWHVGLIRNYVRLTFPDNHPAHEDPYILRWTRPAEMAPGLVMAFQLYLPFTGARMPLEQDLMDVTWIEPSSSDGCTEVSLFLASARAATTDWPGKDSMATKLVGFMTLDDGQILWVVSRDTTCPPCEVTGGATFMRGTLPSL